MRNNELFYREIRENSILIKDGLKEEDLENLVNACSCLFRLSHIARKEGLLALEEEADEKKLGNLIFYNELIRMIKLVVDGTDPFLIEDSCLKRYFSRNYTGVEGLIFLVYMDGLLQIQEGMSLYMLEENIRSYMPEEVDRRLADLKEKENAREKNDNKAAWDKMFDRDFPLKDQEIYDYTVKLADYCFIYMTEEELALLAEEIDKYDLALLLKGLSGEAVKKLYKSLSEDRAASILVESESMGPVRCFDIDGVADKVFKTIVMLSDKGQVKVPDDLDRIFDVRYINDGLHRISPEEAKVDAGIKKWFMGMTNGDIQRVLKEIPRDTLGMAMKNWDRELKKLIYGNLPKPAAAIVADNVKHMECSQYDINEANNEIEDVIRRLEDCAEIFIRDSDKIT
ncbi:MAG: hypothetical protein K6F99_10400 [Lachnospiraceae bacterium]|nr:hypothetical protein [Lachnospiraceae bacterium]